MTDNLCFYSASKRENRVVLFFFVLLVGIFTVYPQLDVFVARYFYSVQDGFVFNKQFMFITHGIRWIAEIIILIVIFLSASTFFIKIKPRNSLIIRFIAIVLFLGPILTVDYGLKKHWGRARPDHIIEFGGSAEYTMPFLPASQCFSNCSFVSGHATAGYALILLGAITGRRMPWLKRGIILGLLIGFVRIIQGKHFLSDVLFSFFPVWIAMELGCKIFNVWTLKGRRTESA